MNSQEGPDTRFIPLLNPMRDKFLDLDGQTKARATHDDLRTLEERVYTAIASTPGFESDDDLNVWMGLAQTAYEAGWYARARSSLLWSIRRIPEVEPLVSYYLRICDRTLESPLTEEEIDYTFARERYRALPAWLRIIERRGAPARMQCKWCGRFTEWVSPDRPTFGFDSHQNSCTQCGQMYPMPSWVWDSPEGRAYSYYRGSFGGDHPFYEEFERDYDPRPRR